MGLSVLHFIGFTHPDQPGKPDAIALYRRAARIFGAPDFVHRYWDRRAHDEVVADDVAVFATGCERDTPRENAFDDSAQM